MSIIEKRDNIELSREELKDEIWKKIEDSDYKWEISNMGRLKRVEAFHKKYEGTITLGRKDNRGYRRISIKINGEYTEFKVHRLVARYFLNGYSEELTVNHKNFDKSDNRLSNLELLTIRENIYHYQKNKVQSESTSSRIGVAFHRGIGKWTTRITYNKKRYSLGVFDTEDEAVQAVNEYKETHIEAFNIGKGVLNKGKRKYNEEEISQIRNDLNRIGVRKTRKKYNIGYSTLKLIKKGEYFDER